MKIVIVEYSGQEIKKLDEIDTIIFKANEQPSAAESQLIYVLF